MATKYDQNQARKTFESNASAGIPDELTALGIAITCEKEEAWQIALAEWKKQSGYRRDGRGLADLLDDVCTRRDNLVLYEGTPQVHDYDEKHLLVERISCVDADGNAFEQYDRLLVDKDVVRSDDGKHVNFIPYRAITHFEKEGSLFLPSMALSCNIAAALYQHRDDPEVKPVLLHYKNHGAGFGWHAQNTVIDWGEQKIIHYPHKNDFTEHGGKTGINQARQRTLLPFARKEKRKIFWDRTLSNTTLEKGLEDPLMTRFVRQLTGLENPSLLVEIGNYFGKTARVWVSSSTETRAAWFGCGSDGLDLSGSDNLSSNSAGRGVRLEGAVGAVVSEPEASSSK